MQVVISLWGAWNSFDANVCPLCFIQCEWHARSQTREGWKVRTRKPNMLKNLINKYLESIFKIFCSWQQTYIFSVTLAMRSNTTDWLHNFEISSTTSPIYAIRLKTQCTKMKTLGRATISIFSNENQNLRQKVFNRGFAFVQGSLTFWNLTQFHLFKVLHNSIWRAWSFVCVD